MKKHEFNQTNWTTRAGWSLFELLTVVVVLSIAAVIAIPYAASGDSASGQSAARLLVSEILGAQMDAISSQTFRRIHFYDDGTPSLGGSVELLCGSFSCSLTIAPLAGKLSINETTGGKI